MRAEEAIEVLKQVLRDQLLTVEALNTLAIAAMKKEEKEDKQIESE